LESAVKLNPDFLPAQVAMVDLDVRQGKINKALQRAEALRNSRPNSTIGDIIAGDTLMRAHRPAEALEAYKVAFKRAPNSHIVARLFKAHRAVSSVTAALPHLAGWVASHPEDIQSRRLLASAYGDLGKTKIAIQHSEIILRKLPNDAAILNNLALLYQSTNDSRSLAYAERAFKHAPKHPATLDSLGWVLVQRGDMARGLKFLRMAYNRASREPEIQYHLGVALSRMGRLNEARNQLKSALKSGKFFQGKSDARDLLKSLSEK
jgi:predicted Zn-dependent protease